MECFGYGQFGTAQFGSSHIVSRCGDTVACVACVAKFGRQIDMLNDI